jgi:O-antigen ligase
MAALSLDRAGLARLADGLAVAVAVSLPWSTSATGILLVLWLLALLPTLTWSDIRRALATPAGGLPALLVLLGVIGMAWAQVSWHARWGGLDGFAKLLVIPLLMAQSALIRPTAEDCRQLEVGCREMSEKGQC